MLQMGNGSDNAVRFGDLIAIRNASAAGWMSALADELTGTPNEIDS